MECLGAQHLGSRGSGPKAAAQFLEPGPSELQFFRNGSVRFNHKFAVFSAVLTKFSIFENEDMPILPPGRCLFSFTGRFDVPVINVPLPSK